MNEYFLPLSIILASLICALIIKKYVLQRLQSWTAKTKWNGDDIIVTVLDKSILLWMLLGGSYLSIIYTPLDESKKVIFDKAFLVVFVISIAVSLSTMIVSFFQINSEKKLKIFQQHRSLLIL